MSRNTRENPHRKLWSPQQVELTERYHAARRRYPVGGKVPYLYPPRPGQSVGDNGAAALTLMATLALRSRRRG